MYRIVKTGCKLAGGSKIINTLKMYIGMIKILNWKKGIIKIKVIYIYIGVEASVTIYDVSTEGIVYISRRSRSSVIYTQI